MGRIHLGLGEMEVGGKALHGRFGLPKIATHRASIPFQDIMAIRIVIPVLALQVQDTQ